jgi:hypothetical protein
MRRAIYKLLVNYPSMDMIRPALYAIYQKDRELCFDMIRGLVMSGIRSFALLPHDMEYTDRQVWLEQPSLESNKGRQNISDEELQKFRTFYDDNRSMLREKVIKPLYELFNKKDCAKPNYHPFMFFLNGLIDGYYRITETLFLIKYEGRLYLGIMTNDTPDQIVLSPSTIDEYMEKGWVADHGKNHHVIWSVTPKTIQMESMSIVKEGLANKLKRVTGEFLGSLHINPEGDVRFKIKDKLTFEHYEEVHKLLRACVDNKNYEEMKINIAYVFAIISMIEDDPVYKEHDTKSDEYKELLRLRAHYISDFKVHHRIIMKHEPDFNFTEFYANSSVNRDVYTIQKKHIKNAVALFKALV